MLQSILRRLLTALCAATLIGVPGCGTAQRPQETEPVLLLPDAITPGTEDFAYSGFKRGVMAMGETNAFTFADNERDGNLSFREREGYAHDGTAANEYMYNALRFFWN